MTPLPKADLLSIVGSSYFQPITDLWPRLVACPFAEPNDVRAAPREHGYSAALSILAVACLELYIMRVRFKIRAHHASKERHPLEFLTKVYPDLPTVQVLTEVFVLREALVHNQLWLIEYSWDDEEPMRLLEASLDSICADKKFSGCVDLSTKQTRTLCLNVVPVRVNRRDVGEVMRVVWETLLFIEPKGRDLCYVSHSFATRTGMATRFGDVVDEMRAWAVCPLVAAVQQTAAGAFRGAQ